MSSQRYILKGVTSNGTITSPSIGRFYERGYISVNFYTDATLTTLVTPSAGTLTFKASENGEQYGTITDGTVDATLVEYDRPNFSGSVGNIQATASGIIGAANYRAFISMFGG